MGPAADTRMTRFLMIPTDSLRAIVVSGILKIRVCLKDSLDFYRELSSVQNSRFLISLSVRMFLECFQNLIQLLGFRESLELLHVIGCNWNIMVG